MQQDVQVIEAVRDGDRERYGELIERYQRLVYGIAWSRLGDRDLSEDVAQETFVQAYRYLATLRRPERFGAWVARIARNMTAAIARRSKLEREGLRRWQLEQPDTQPPEAGAPKPEESLHDPIRQALETLPVQHRESLVLYYLEGRSQEECARRLGINEGAFRTRLHRARAVLRRDLEHRLADSLADLAPRPDLSRRVLAILPAMPLFTKTLKSKLLGSPLLILLLPLIQIYAFGAILGWLDRVLDQPDRNEREFWKRVLGLHSLTGMFLFSALIGGILWLFDRFVPGLSPFLTGQLMILLGFGVQNYLLMKFLPPNRGWSYSIAILVFIIGILIFYRDPIEQMEKIMVIYSWSIFIFSLSQILSGRMNQSSFLFLSARGKNLFRWALQELSEKIDEENQPMPGGCSLAQLRGFGRLLLEHRIVVSSMVNLISLFRRNKEIRLYLYSAEPIAMTGYYMVRLSVSCKPADHVASIVKIRTDGAVKTSLSRADELPLQKMTGRPIDKEALERRLAVKIQAALSRYCAGDGAGALRLLGEECGAENDAYSSLTPHRAVPGQRPHKSQRILYGVLIVAAFFVAQSGLKITSRASELGPISGKPVRCEEAFALLSGWAGTADQPGAKGRSLIVRALQGPRFPPVQDLPPGAREKIRTIALDRLRQEHGKILTMLTKESMLVNLVANSLQSGLLSKTDLATVGLTAEAIRQKLAQSDPATRIKILEPDWSYINLGLSTTALEEYAQRLSVLKALGCLDLVDGEKMARFIASHQCPPGIPANKPRSSTYCPGLIIYEKAIEMALFKPTCYSLRILQTLGRLDLIDHEACTRAILSFYVGHGYFRAKMADHVFVLGEDDHYLALESLVILGALDRVRDLKDWKYYHEISPEDARNPGMLAFLQVRLVEYCSYTKRLEELQRQLKGSSTRR